VGQPTELSWLGLRNRRYPSSNLSLNQPMPTCPLLLTPTFLPSLRLPHTLHLLSLVLIAYRSLPFCYCDDKQASDSLSRYFCRNLQKGDSLPSSRSAPYRVSTPEISARVVPSHPSIARDCGVPDSLDLDLDPGTQQRPELLHSLADRSLAKMSDYYDDDELDIRVRRGRASPGVPVVVRSISPHIRSKNWFYTC
jgi:hypothetical protein